MPEIELILFAIQAGIKLGAQFQKSYIDSTVAAEITLPLPNFPSSPTTSSAKTFFVRDGATFVGSDPALGALLTKASASGLQSLTAAEQSSLITLYKEYFVRLQTANGQNANGDPIDLSLAGANPAGLTSTEILSFLTIRQWQKGRDPNPSMLHAMAGTFIDIAVQYLATMPGAVSTKTNEGKALQGFLQTVSTNVSFATAGPDQIVEQLFLATVQTIKSNPAVIGGGSKSQALVSNVLSAVYDKAKQQVAAATGDLDEQDNIRSFAQMLMSTALSSAAKTVFGDPGKYLGVGKPGEAGLITAVAGSLMDSLTNGSQINLRDLLTPQTLQGIVQSALKVVGQHPEILGTGNKGLTTLIGSIATTLADPSVKLDHDAVPQIIQMILARTADNFELLVPNTANPAQHLLVSAAKEVLTIISAAPPAGSKWTLKFTSQDSLQLADFVFSQVVDNPDWLVSLSGGAQSRMGAVVQAVLSTLRANGTPNLSKTAGLAILKSVLTACADRLDFLKKDAGGQLLLTGVLDASIGVLFNPGNDPAAKWLALANDTVPQVVNVVFQLLAKHGVTAARIATVKTFLQQTLSQIPNGGTWSVDNLAAQLEALL